uniref:rRNA biogenesis protein RRP36 n=1 Tax=Syphacia muris TaxID=451379 RepID=A0A0N5A8T0_9BILA
MKNKKKSQLKSKNMAQKVKMKIASNSNMEPIGNRRKFHSKTKDVARKIEKEVPSCSKMDDLEKHSDKELSEHPETAGLTISRKKRRLHTYERALLMYEKIQAERREQAEKRRLEHEQRREALERYLGIKKKMDKALMKRNRRGQPNLNAQMQVLLEKIEKRVAK